MIFSLLKSVSLHKMVVLFTKISLFIFLYERPVVFLGAPEAKCIVSRLDRVVVVYPLYEKLWSSQSPSVHLY